LLLAAGYALQTAGLERTTVSSTGFITGMYVVLTPLIALLLYRSRIGLAAWGGVLVATAGLAMLSGIHAGSATGDLLVLAAAAVYSLQIVLMERYAPCHDALAFTFVEMAAAFAGLLVVALAHGDLSVPHGWTVWGALLVTGVFASALGYLVQTWAQRRTSATRTALAFTMEPVWTGIFGFALAGDRLGALGWGGCAVIFGGILLAEPAAAGALARLVGGRTARGGVGPVDGLRSRAARVGDDRAPLPRRAGTRRAHRRRRADRGGWRRARTRAGAAGAPPRDRPRLRLRRDAAVRDPRQHRPLARG